MIIEPAFPVQDASAWQAHGITNRDYFAARALEGLASQMLQKQPAEWLSLVCKETGRTLDQQIAHTAWMLADAMMKAR
jgi:hypothetical protein